MGDIFKIYPVGFIRKKNDTVLIEIDEKYNAALLGLEQFSHINVLYWFHENDNSESRNMIAMSLCKILSIDGTTIKIDKIDAFDGSPVIDIKCFFPKRLSIPDVRVPDWERKQE